MIQKVSIIIPVYNAEKYIDRCLKSIANQTLGKFEVIIVNDCSTDNSKNLINNFIKEDSRFRLINHTENMGAMCARETGYTNAIADYLLFVDSDDYLPLNAIELLYNKIVNEDADIVIGGMKYVNSKKTISVYSPPIKIFCNNEEIVKSFLRGTIHGGIASNIYKRSLFQIDFMTFKGMSISEDSLMSFQLIDNVNKVAVLNEIVYYYFMNENSSSHNINMQGFKSKINTDKFVYQKYCKNRNYTSELNAFIIRSIGRLVLSGCPKEYLIDAYDFVDVKKLMRLSNIYRYLRDYKVIISFLLYHLNIYKSKINGNV